MVLSFREADLPMNRPLKLSQVGGNVLPADRCIPHVAGFGINCEVPGYRAAVRIVPLRFNEVEVWEIRILELIQTNQRLWDRMRAHRFTNELFGFVCRNISRRALVCASDGS